VSIKESIPVLQSKELNVSGYLGSLYLRVSEVGNTCPFWESLGAATHPDGARLEVRGSRLRAKSTFSCCGLKDECEFRDNGVLQKVREFRFISIGISELLW
jgi:hypothetical protein